MRKKILYILIISLLILSTFFLQCGRTDEHGHSHVALSEDSTHTNHEHEGITDGHSHEENAPPHEAEGGAHTHNHSEEQNAGIAGHRHLSISPEIIKQWGIQHTEVKERDYIETVILTGVVKENQEATYIVNALVPGIVTSIEKDVGDPVKKGDTLCVLNSPELLELKTNFIKAGQEYRLTQENYDRAIKLFKIKGIEQKELTGRESAYKTSMAEYFSLEAELRTICSDRQTFQKLKDAAQKDEKEKLKSFLSPFYKILSPGNGKVMMRDIRLGERIDTSRKIFEVSDTRQMWVILNALEKDLPYIEKNKEVQIETDVYPGITFQGHVLNLEQKIDPELRTVKVRIGVDNADSRLKPEMYVRGRVDKKMSRKQCAVPEKALVKLSGIDGVFVIEDGEFLFKAVQVMEIDSAGYAFINGLKTGDLVVSTGAFYLKAEYEIQSGKADPHAGHNH